MANISGSDIRSAEFRTAIRGIDRVEVVAFLSTVADRIDELEAQHATLSAQIGESSNRDLESEFDAVGREISGILQTAREAADAMRERAAADAAVWRADAMAEVDESRKQAAADSEALRRDAWTTGTELLEQSAVEAGKMRDQAERDVLTTMGEAEREAHRLTSGARREAEDVVRQATMDAEKTMSQAVKRRDEIIDEANHQAATAQERARALEQRRDELLDELENVRSTLTQLEGSLEEKRETMDLVSSPDQGTTVRVVPNQPVDIEEWEPGETVRIVREEDPQPAAPVVVEADPDPGPEPDAEPEPEITAESTSEFEASPEPETDAEPAPAPEPIEPAEESTGDALGALFASLRSGADELETVESVSPETEPDPEPVAESPSTTDWIDERDSRLLPITNRALRGTKKAMTELQNVALDGLRTDEEWRPDSAGVDDALHGELVGLWTESFAAGHAVAEVMTGSKIKRPATPDSDATSDFSKALVDAVNAALESSSGGQRERQAAASKVFRVWRTDEAERRIREIAIHAYEQAIEASVHANV